MKPWLFDILACPIDKNFPLKLYIFSYETSNEKIQSILEIPKHGNINKLKSENVVIISQENGKISVQDDLIMEKTPLVSYLNLIKNSVEELENIQDLSGIESSKMLLERIRTDIYINLKKCISSLPKNDLDEILPELVVINKFKFEIEIETGILFCPKCKRWFPIIDTIPQMLPDEYRDEKAEIEFLKTNKNLLHKEFFQQNLKPFNI
ncbi:MAG: Trm112 family protein [Candidatus Thorarchaeota archaeon]